MLRGMRDSVRTGLVVLAIAAGGSARVGADTYPRQAGVSITHYAFDVTLTDASSEIAVTEVVDVRFTASGVTGIDLDLCDVDPARTPSAIVDPCVGARAGAGRAGGAAASPGGGGLSGSANQAMAPTGMTVTSVVADGAPVSFTHRNDRLHLALPTANERQMIVQRVAQEWSKANPSHPAQIEPTALAKLVDNLNGLTAADAERLVRQAIFDDGALTMADL